METRKNSVKSKTRLAGAAELPKDFTKLVREVYTTNFEEGLAELKKTRKAKSAFEVRGAIYANEIVMGVSLVPENAMAATTIYASVDFDPTASTPTAQDLLAVCVDAIGSLFGTLLDIAKPERIAQLAAGSLSSFEEIPFEWTKIDFENRRVWMLVDKANPVLDEMTDRWLAENDPHADDDEAEFEDEVKDLFMSGKSRPASDDDDSTH